jgi:hypothetical protein
MFCPRKRRLAIVPEKEFGKGKRGKEIGRHARRWADWADFRGGVGP